MRDVYTQAERQHSLVTRQQGVALVGRAAFDREVRGRRLQRAGPSVFRVPGSVPTWHQDLLCAVWSQPAGAVASHRSAAALWRLPGFPPGPIEVLRTRSGGHRSGAMVLRQTSFLPPHHVTETAAIPTTSAERTVLDLCGLVHPERAERIVDHVVAVKLSTLPALAVVLAECAASGRPGITVLRHLLAERGDHYVPPESELERLVLAVLRR